MTRLRRALPRPMPRWTLPATLLVLLGLAAWINEPIPGVSGREARAVAALPVAPAFRAGQRVLLLSPHPDDETLCCAGMLNRARAAGAQVSVTWITAGDGFEFDAALTERTLHPRGRALRDLGERRVGEARAAAVVLGIPLDRQAVLGYPDGGLRFLNGVNFDRPYTSPRTGASAVYLREAQTPGAPFTGEALEADLERVLRRVNPDVILIPAHDDFHPDHHTLTLFAQRVAARLGLQDRLRYWVVHGGLEWPLPKGTHPGLPLVPPPLARHLPWQRVPLDAEDLAVKTRAVAAYRTQTEVLGRFMRAFERRNELLSPSDTAR
ncbi:PIG-L deacetylase family protein [Deinococcus sedimenti]|uniref:PIG-L domain-containing protein n=1 Tax=Deinococcus sedimenti TaxID=1867090 RepID=A0ABQ2S8R0_9DEIO|nr:PIG-L family deacetylase [Deinococcus sedimenti]GGS01068.1 PIG-L domain-containing protein [Deinococcus sedimenti]